MENLGDFEKTIKQAKAIGTIKSSSKFSKSRSI